VAEPTRAERTLAVAERVRAALAEHGVDCALIGAMAMAVHNYARSTRDLDLGTATDPFRVLAPLARELRAQGLDAVLNEPDHDDPLGGVVNVSGDDFDPIQIVNFLNPLGGGENPGLEAVQQATPVPGTSFRVVDLPHLIALKLYAGGPKSKLDVIELITRNPTLDLERTRDVCARFGLGEALSSLLNDLGRG
jgi:hypothetical protein